MNTENKEFEAMCSVFAKICNMLKYDALSKSDLDDILAVKKLSDKQNPGLFDHIIEKAGLKEYLLAFKCSFLYSDDPICLNQDLDKKAYSNWYVACHFALELCDIETFEILYDYLINNAPYNTETPNLKDFGIYIDEAGGPKCELSKEFVAKYKELEGRNDE